MGKFIKFWGAVLAVVFMVEMALGYLLVPVANIAVVGIGVFASLVVVVLFAVLVMLLRDRERERRYQAQRERRTSAEHRETVRVLGLLSMRQQIIIDRLLDEGCHGYLTDPNPDLLGSHDRGLTHTRSAPKHLLIIWGSVV